VSQKLRLPGIMASRIGGERDREYRLIRRTTGVSVPLPIRTYGVAAFKGRSSLR
jgi:hypothetical protein